MAGNIDIDLGGVRAFGEALHVEVTRGIRPNAVAIVRDSEPDIVHYGVRMATPAMTSARIRLQDSLALALDNMRRFVNVSQSMVAAVDTLIAAYESADGVSREAAEKILADATAQADLARARYEAAQVAAAHVSLPDDYLPADGGMA